jgi:hypothetical protein
VIVTRTNTNVHNARAYELRMIMKTRERYLRLCSSDCVSNTQEEACIYSNIREEVGN